MLYHLTAEYQEQYSKRFLFDGRINERRINPGNQLVVSFLVSRLGSFSTQLEVNNL